MTAKKSLPPAYLPDGNPDEYKARAVWCSASPFLVLQIKQSAKLLMRWDIEEGRKFLDCFGALSTHDLVELSQMHYASVAEMAHEAYRNLPGNLAARLGVFL